MVLKQIKICIKKFWLLNKHLLKSKTIQILMFGLMRVKV